MTSGENRDRGRGSGERLGRWQLKESDWAG